MALETVKEPECLCPETADYHLPYCPVDEGDDVFTEFTEEQIRLCHDAKEFDHECVVCGAEDDESGEAVPGRDF